MKKAILVVIIVVVIVIVVAGVVAYLFYSGVLGGRPRGFNQRNFQLNQSQIDDVTNFFSSNPNNEQIQTYCNQSRMNCFYYCRTIDPNNNYCTQMMNATRMGNFTRGNFTRGNYTGNYTRRQGGMPGGMPPMPPG